MHHAKLSQLPCTQVEAASLGRTPAGCIDSELILEQCSDSNATHNALSPVSTLNLPVDLPWYLMSKVCRVCKVIKDLGRSVRPAVVMSLT